MPPAGARPALAALAAVLAGPGCEEPPREPAPTLLIAGFEVPEVPTDAAVLDLEYVIPEDFVPPDDHRIVLALTLSGPEGIAALGEPDLEAAPDWLPAGEPGQVGAWFLPILDGPGPQDILDGAQGRTATFSLPFSAEDEGSVSAALSFFDVAPDPGDGTAPEAGAHLSDLQVVRLTFHGGDEEAVVTTD